MTVDCSKLLVYLFSVKLAGVALVAVLVVEVLEAVCLLVGLLAKVIGGAPAGCFGTDEIPLMISALAFSPLLCSFLIAYNTFK